MVEAVVFNVVDEGGLRLEGLKEVIGEVSR